MCMYVDRAWVIKGRNYDLQNGHALSSTICVSFAMLGSTSDLTFCYTLAEHFSALLMYW